MNKRNTFHGNALENLEDRQLLNAAGLGRLGLRPAQIAPPQAGRQAGGIQIAASPNRQLGANVLRNRATPIPQGPVSTDFSQVRPNLPVNTANAQLNVPQVRRGQVPTTSLSPTGSNTYPVNPNALGLGIGSGVPGQSSTISGRSISIQTRSFSPTGGLSQATNAVFPTIFTQSVAPTTGGEGAKSSATTMPTTKPLPSVGGGVGRMMAAPGEAGATDLTYVPMPFDMLDGAVLSKAQVAGLQKAAADLATNHTLGVDATRDKAAIDAFQTTLDDLARGIWTQVNVTSKVSATALKDAAAAFADGYTAGADQAKDQAAWKAFNTALGEFTRSIRNPNAPETNVPEGPMNDGPWLNMPTMMAGGSVKYLAAGLLDGQPVNSDDLAGVKGAIDAFALAYTSGADKAKDLAAGESLLNAIGDVMSKRWERLAPPEVRDLIASNNMANATPAPMPMPMGEPVSMLRSISARPSNAPAVRI